MSIESISNSIPNKGVIHIMILYWCWGLQWLQLEPSEIPSVDRHPETQYTHHPHPPEQCRGEYWVHIVWNNREGFPGAVACRSFKHSNGQCSHTWQVHIHANMIYRCRAGALPTNAFHMQSVHSAVKDLLVQPSSNHNTSPHVNKLQNTNKTIAQSHVIKQ